MTEHSIKNHSKSVGEPRKLVSIWLDDYDNIFSDFDPRSFSQKELSDDFINETRKLLHMERERLVQLIILMPVGKRNKSEEHVIKNRIHHHFRHTYEHLLRNRRKYTRKGAFIAALGFVFMLFTSAISIFGGEHYAMTILKVFLEPSGWFMVWYGLDSIFYMSRMDKDDYEFSRIMAKADVVFDSYQPRS